MFLTFHGKGEPVDLSKLRSGSRGKLLGLEQEQRCVKLDASGKLSRILIDHVLIRYFEYYFHRDLQWWPTLESAPSPLLPPPDLPILRHQPHLIHLHAGHEPAAGALITVEVGSDPRVGLLQRLQPEAREAEPGRADLG